MEDVGRRFFLKSRKSTLPVDVGGTRPSKKDRALSLGIALRPNLMIRD